MAIKPPAWCSQAIPGPNGWTDPNSGEVYASARFTQEQLDEYYGKVEEVVSDMYGVDHNYTAVTEQVVVEEPQMLNEAPSNNKSLQEMTKAELEALGRQHGVELDRRKSKATLVERMKNLLG